MSFTNCCNRRFIGDNHSPIQPDGYCLFCGFHPEIESLKAEIGTYKSNERLLRQRIEELKSILNEAVNILRDGCLVYDQYVPSGVSSFRSDADWFIKANLPKNLDSSKERV